MQTMRVHAHVVDLLESSGTPGPTHWRHDLTSGSVSYRFAGSSNTYCWDADAVASMKLELTTEPESAAGRELLARWTSIRELLDQTGQRDPDAVLIDNFENETTLIWESEKLAVILEHAAEAEAQTGAACSAGPLLDRAVPVAAQAVALRVEHASCDELRADVRGDAGQSPSRRVGRAVTAASRTR